jgi:TRAP-type C4-dicarboxylate transport system substrate-binding protein
VQIKWYLSAVAGNELQIAERIKREQLDGIVSAGMLCSRLAPSMRVLRLPGLFRERDEAIYVMNRLKPAVDEELLGRGFVNLAEAGLGFSVLLSRTPIHSLSELKHNRIWLWDLDETLQQFMPDLFTRVLLPVEKTAQAYDEGALDGFIITPTAAVAFQLSSKAAYVSPLRVAYLAGCFIVTRRVFDQLSVEAQQELRTAAAKLQQRVEDLGRQQDQLLLGGLFAKQGAHVLPVAEPFRAEFENAVARPAKPVDEHVSGAPPATVRGRVDSWLADYRSHHAHR